MQNKQSSKDFSYEKEVTSLLHKTAADIGKIVRPYIVYASESYNILLPILANLIIGTTIPTMTNPLSSFVNGIFGIIIGVQQLSDTGNYRPNATRAKGLINFLNGSQLIGIHALGATALFPPSFAVLSGAGFVLSLEEAVQACRRLHPQYFLKDSLAKMNKQAQSIEALTAELLLSTQDWRATYDTLFSTIIKQKYQELSTLQRAQEQIHTEIKTQITLLLLDGQQEQVNKLTAAYAATDWFQDFKLPQCREDVDPNETDTLKNAHQEIRTKNRQVAKEMIMNTMIWGLLFTGAVLLCIPGLQIPGGAMLAIATFAYAAKVIPTGKGMTQIFKTALSGVKQEHMPPQEEPSSGLGPQNQTR